MVELVRVIEPGASSGVVFSLPSSLSLVVWVRKRAPMGLASRVVPRPTRLNPLGIPFRSENIVVSDAQSACVGEIVSESLRECCRSYV